MFIGKYDQSVEFARMPGRSDSKPRPKRSMLSTAAKGAGAIAGVGALALGAKNAPKAIKTGMRAAKSASNSAGGAKMGGLGTGLKTGAASLKRGVGKDLSKGVGKVKSGAGTAKNKFVKAVAKRRGLMT